MTETRDVVPNFGLTHYLYSDGAMADFELDLGPDESPEELTAIGSMMEKIDASGIYELTTVSSDAAIGEALLKAANVYRELLEAKGVACVDEEPDSDDIARTRTLLFQAAADDVERSRLESTLAPQPSTRRGFLRLFANRV